MLAETLGTAVPAGIAAQREAGTRGGQVGHGGWGAAGRQMLRVITKQTETGGPSTLNMCHFNVLQLYLNKMKSWPVSSRLTVHCCPPALGKQVLMRKFN